MLIRVAGIVYMWGGWVWVRVYGVGQQAAYLAAQDAADAADAGHVELVADPIRQQALAYLPCENARVFLLQLAYVRHDLPNIHEQHVVKHREYGDEVNTIE